MYAISPNTWFMRVHLLPLLVCLAGVNALQAQAIKNLPLQPESRDIIEVLIKAFHISVKEKPPGKKRVSFSIIPVSTESSGGSKVLVSSINAAFVLGHEDSTKVSSVYFLPYTDFSENFGFGTKVNLWTPGNTWNIPSEFRISTLAQYSYGLGSDSEHSDQFKVTYNNVRFYFSGNHKLTKNFFGGLGVNYDRYYKVGVENFPTTPSEFEKYGIGTGSTSFSTGVTFNLLYDNRRNSINPDNGFYTSIVYRVNPPQLLNDYQWSSIYLDTRKYYRISSEKRQILALWGFYWGSYGNVPYLNLPGTQQEFGGRSGRGFPRGRFIGRQMLYFESEYRFDITSNGLLGAVVFANFQSLTDPSNNKFQYVNPAAGFGARIKFNKESNTNLTLDFGFGKNSFSFYIGLGEFF